MITLVTPRRQRGFLTPPQFKKRFEIDAVDFDGVNDVMTRGAALSSVSDSKLGIMSVWVRVDGGDGAVRRIFNAIDGTGALTGPRFSWNASNQFLITLTGASNFQMRSAAHTAGATWLHVLASWDRNGAPGSAKEHLYVNDVNEKVVTIIGTDTADLWSTFTDWALGGATDVSPLTDLWNGCMAEFYLAVNQFLDFSVAANRRKFIQANGNPADLGPNGARPTGTAPTMYHTLKRGDPTPANFAINRGTGGNFAETGAVAIASDSPTD